MAPLDDMPPEFKCPLSGDIMTDPVLLVETGVTFQRCAIEDWFARGLDTCPKTQARLTSSRLEPDPELKRRVLAWLKAKRDELQAHAPQPTTPWVSTKPGTSPTGSPDVSPRYGSSEPTLQASSGQQGRAQQQVTAGDKPVAQQQQPEAPSGRLARLLRLGPVSAASPLPIAGGVAPQAAAARPSPSPVPSNFASKWAEQRQSPPQQGQQQRPAPCVTVPEQPAARQRAPSLPSTVSWPSMSPVHQQPPAQPTRSMFADSCRQPEPPQKPQLSTQPGQQPMRRSVARISNSWASKGAGGRAADEPAAPPRSHYTAPRTTRTTRTTQSEPLHNFTTRFARPAAARRRLIPSSSPVASPLRSASLSPTPRSASLPPTPRFQEWQERQPPAEAQQPLMAPGGQPRPQPMSPLQRIQAQKEQIEATAAGQPYTGYQGPTTTPPMQPMAPMVHSLAPPGHPSSGRAPPAHPHLPAGDQPERPGRVHVHVDDCAFLDCLGRPCRAALAWACPQTQPCDAPKLAHCRQFGTVVVHTFRLPQPGPARSAMEEKLAKLQQMRDADHVLPLLNYSCDDYALRLKTVTPFQAKGSMRSVLQWRHSEGIPPATPYMAFLWQVAHGLCNMHASRVVHGHVMASNVLLSSSGKACLACLTEPSILPAVGRGGGAGGGANGSCTPSTGGSRQRSRRPSMPVLSDALSSRADRMTAEASGRRTPVGSPDAWSEGSSAHQLDTPTSHDPSVHDEDLRDDIRSFGYMALELATGRQLPDAQVLRDRGCFDETLPGPQGIRDIIWRCLLPDAQLRPTADALQEALSLHAAGSESQVTSILRGVMPVRERRGVDAPPPDPRARLPPPDIQQLDVQRAAWLAARMLSEAAKAQTPQARGAAVSTDSLLAGLGLAYMQLQRLEGRHARGFGFVISRARSSGGRISCSLPSMFKADAMLDCPSLQSGEAVACVFSLKGELLAAFDGTRSSVQLMKALRLEGCHFTPEGCRLVGCLASVQDFRLLDCKIKAKDQYNALLYRQAVPPRSVLGCTPIDAHQPVPGGLLQGGLSCPPGFGVVYGELARCLQCHDDILNMADPPLHTLPSGTDSYETEAPGYSSRMSPALSAQSANSHYDSPPSQGSTEAQAARETARRIMGSSSATTDQTGKPEILRAASSAGIEDDDFEAQLTAAAAAAGGSAAVMGAASAAAVQGRESSAESLRARLQGVPFHDPERTVDRTSAAAAGNDVAARASGHKTKVPTAEDISRLQDSVQSLAAGRSEPGPPAAECASTDMRRGSAGQLPPAARPSHQVEDDVPIDGWDVHTVKDGDMAAAAAWLTASLATAVPGITTYILRPGPQANSSFEQLCNLLLVSGCMSSLNKPGLCFFTYLGSVEETYANLEDLAANTLCLRGGGGDASSAGSPAFPQQCGVGCAAMQLKERPSKDSCVQFDEIDGTDEVQIKFVEQLPVVRGSLQKRLQAQAVVALQLSACSDAGQTCIKLERLQAWLQDADPSATDGRISTAKLVASNAVLRDFTVEFRAAEIAAHGKRSPMSRRLSSINPATLGSRSVLSRKPVGNIYRVKENGTVEKHCTPAVDIGPDHVGFGGVGVDISKAKVESEQPTYQRSDEVELVSMERAGLPLRGDGVLPATLTTTRDVFNTLIAGQQGPQLLSMMCDGGTMLIVEGRPAHSPGITISCCVGATALLLPDMSELLRKRLEPKDVHIAMGDRRFFPITFSGTAEMEVMYGVGLGQPAAGASPVAQGLAMTSSTAGQSLPEQGLNP